MKNTLWRAFVILALFGCTSLTIEASASGEPNPDERPRSGLIRHELGSGRVENPVSISEADPFLEDGFPVRAWHDAGISMSGPAIHTLIGNIDADPELEIVVSGISQGPLYAWNHDGSRVPGWPVGYYNRTFYPALGNLSEIFPGMEIFTGQFIFRVPETPPAPLLAYSGSGTLLPGWPRDSANDIWGPAMLADVDGDHLDEIFISEPGLHAYRSDGTPLPGWPVASPDPSYAIADLDLNGDLEIVTFTDWTSEGAYLVAYHHDGTPVESFSFFFQPFRHPFPVIGDVDGDKSLEIILFSHTNDEPSFVVYVISAEGELEQTLPGHIGDGHCYKDIQSAIALGDVNGDGIPEIVIGYAGGLMVWKGDGTAVPGFPAIWDGCYEHWEGNGAPVVGDVTGDGQPEIVLTAKNYASSRKGVVYVSDNQGNLLSGFPKELNIGGGAVPAIADLDLDGRNEIIISGEYWDGFPGNFNKVWVYDLGGQAHGNIEWGQLQGGPQHQGLYPAPPETYGVDLVIQTAEDPGVTSGSTAGIPVRPKNEGFSMATGVILTAILDPNLTYIADTSEISPTVDGNQLTWNLPNLFFYFNESFTLQVKTPEGVAPGTRFPITFSLSSDQSDENPADNSSVCELTIVLDTFLPFVSQAP